MKCDKLRQMCFRDYADKRGTYQMGYRHWEGLPTWTNSILESTSFEKKGKTISQLSPLNAIRRMNLIVLHMLEDTFSRETVQVKNVHLMTLGRQC